MAIRTIVAEKVAEMLRGENNERTGEPTDVRGDVQSEVQGLPVSSEDDRTDDESEVVDNSGTEEEISAETKDVEVNVIINVQDEDEEVKTDDTETSDI